MALASILSAVAWGIYSDALKGEICAADFRPDEV